MACASERHKMHMCALQAMESKKEFIKTLTEKATVECEVCGARVNDPQYLCNPRQLLDKD